MGGLRTIQNRAVRPPSSLDMKCFVVVGKWGFRKLATRTGPATIHFCEPPVLLGFSK